MKHLFLFIGYLVSFIFTEKASWSIGFIRSLIYTGWKKRRFKQMDGFINYPIGSGGENNIMIGKKTVIGKHSLITAWTSYRGNNINKFNPSIKIGCNCHIGEYCHITSISNITIGNNVLMGRFVLITDHGHGNRENMYLPPKERPLYSKGDVYIGNNVWIGDKVTILPGVNIGDGAIIGANAVVTKDIEPMAVVGGNPAEILQ